MDTKFTPGPWSATKYGYERYSVNGPKGEEIAACHRSDNARLIAAAPDMYEALKEMVAGIDAEYSYRVTDINFPKARAALAKAVQS